MAPSTPRNTVAGMQRMTQRAWKLLFTDSAQCIQLADLALARAQAQRQPQAEGRARLVRGFHFIWYASTEEAAAELQRALECFQAVQDRSGQLLAEAGLGRVLSRQGRFAESLQRTLPLRAEGLRLLKGAERGMLLNIIAICYSEMGDSEQAFAYMFQALRETPPARAFGFEVVLHCNLAHELNQIGDYHHALSYADEGIGRCAQLANARLLSILHINRVTSLTGLQRSHEALSDIRRLLDMPVSPEGRGRMNACFEDMAIAALRAGDLRLGADLVERATQALTGVVLPDEALLLRVATAELICTRGEWAQAAQHLEQALPLPPEGMAAGLSLRVRCDFYQALANVHEHLGQDSAALQCVRQWQRLHLRRAHVASASRHQSAALQTELLRLQREVGAIDERRRMTERARAELEAANQLLQQKVAEVQQLQQALQHQATHDFLTSLFNRRHLSKVLPSLLAMAQRDGQPLAVALIDLDHFKQVNDRHGHAAGDRLLAAFGDLLRAQCRRGDVPCRFGGEEFCVLMPRTDIPAARRKLHHLLKAWRETTFQFDSGTLAECTFSAGVADSYALPVSAERLLKLADERLLQAKRLGRNRVLTTSPATLQVVQGSGGTSGGSAA